MYVSFSYRSPLEEGDSGKMGRTEVVGDIIKRGTELALQFMKESKTVKVPPEKEEERAKLAEYEFSFKNAFDLNHNNALLLQRTTPSFYPLLDRCDSIPLETPEFGKLVNQIEKFPDVITGSAENFEPCQLVVYLIELCHHIGSVTSQAKVKGQPLDVRAFLLTFISLISCFGRS
ncbi:DALR anticodon binding domain protein [Cooperia oncophora]